MEKRKRELFLKEVENGQEEEENNLINSEPNILVTWRAKF